ncbi:hypothetical protein BDQ17DRAFT_1538551 [Cyathus striatus]|nr:hypothetical protein BDQ17DRAFT_1538551 [Cyathus striatus]
MSTFSRQTEQPTISGTQSPPLEATGEDKPMGASSVNTGQQDAGAVLDSEQRGQYFQSSEKEGTGSANPQKLGVSLADKMEKRT